MKNRRKTIIVRLDTSIVEQLDNMAAWHGVDRSAILRRILTERFPVEPVTR